MAAPEGYNALGKIGISYKGEYASNTAYERLDAVYHNGSTYLAIKDAPDGAPRDDKINWIYLAKGFSDDIGDTAITFTEAETRENIDTGESVKTVFGRVKKWFADMTAAVFAQIITSNTDLMATTVAGYLPDALAVKQQFDDVNSKLSTKRCVVEERPVEFNNQAQVLIGSLSTLTGGLITSYAQVKGISVKTNGYIGVYVNATTNVYAYKTDIQPMTSNTFTVGLVIDYV